MSTPILRPDLDRFHAVAAFRRTIRPQLVKFREAFFAAADRYGLAPICPLTGNPLSHTSHHVDHVVPCADLLRWFLEGRGLDLDAVAAARTSDGKSWATLWDQGLTESWAGFHQRHAVLRVVSPRGNLTRPRASREHQELIRQAKVRILEDEAWIARTWRAVEGLTSEDRDGLVEALARGDLETRVAFDMARPIGEELKAVPGVGLSRVDVLAWRLASHLEDLASYDFCIEILSLVALGLEPVERLLATYAAADSARREAQKLQAISAGAWMRWVPRGVVRWVVRQLETWAATPGHHLGDLARKVLAACGPEELAGGRAAADPAEDAGGSPHAADAGPQTSETRATPRPRSPRPFEDPPPTPGNQGPRP